jgi:hypothetical protein
MLSIGTKVKVTGFGGFYTAYKEKAVELGLSHWIKNNLPKKNEILTVIGSAPHDYDRSSVIYSIESEDHERQYLTDMSSLKEMNSDFFTDKDFEIC